MGIRLKARKRPNIKPATNMRKVIPVIRVARFIAFNKCEENSYRSSFGGRKQAYIDSADGYQEIILYP